MRHSVWLTSLVVFLWAGSAFAQGGIGTANIQRIFQEMAERKDMQSSLDVQVQRINQEEAERKQRLAKLKADRDQLAPNSPQWAEKNRELLEEAIRFDAWANISRADAQRRQKEMVVTLYNKIREAAQVVAQRDGIDLVIVEQRPEIPEDIARIDMPTLDRIISAQSVIWNSGKMDLTAKITLHLNTEYQKKINP